jgi:hypothetical protein
MALTTQISTAARNAKNDALAALFNTGFIDIYDGAQPAGPGTAIGAQVKLARLALSATAFGSSASGVATANAITTSNALATGTAAWFRALKADGTTAVLDGSVGTSGCNLNLNTTSIVSGSPVAVSAWTLTEPAAGA